MLLGLSEDQEFFRQTTDRFLSERVPPDALRELRHDAAGFGPEYWRQGAELGWTSLLVSEAHGGGSISGDGLVDLGLVAYEFGRHAAPGPLTVVNVVAGALSAADAAPDLLGRLLSGEQVATWCGPAAGPEGWVPTVTARPGPGGFVLDGEARPVESAAQASHFLVSCTDRGDVTQLLVPSSTEGVVVTPLGTVDLTRRFGAVSFQGAVVGADAVVGAERGAVDAVERQLQVLQCLVATEAVGSMQAGFDLTVEWAFDRYSFGRPLASYQALKHRFADMLTWLEASHAIADAAVVAVGARSDDAAELVSAAKAYVGAYGLELLQDCVQIHGGIGVTFEHDLHLYLRRVTVDSALAGTAADHRQRMAVLLEAKGGEAA